MWRTLVCLMHSCFYMFGPNHRNCVKSYVKIKDFENIIFYRTEKCCNTINERENGSQQ
jgi:hypothetical protein